MGPAAAPADGRAEPVPLLRRRWPQVLLAAAAVTVIGFGTTQIVGSRQGDDDAGDSSVASREDAGDQGAAESGRDSDAVPESADAPAQPAPPEPADTRFDAMDQAALAELQRVRPDHVRQDVTRLADAPLRAREDGAYSSQRGEEAFVGGVPLAEVPCGPVYQVQHERRTWVSYGDRLGLVLHYPEVDGLRLVEVFDCQSPTPRRAVDSVTLGTGE